MKFLKIKEKQQQLVLWCGNVYGLFSSSQAVCESRVLGRGVPVKEARAPLLQLTRCIHKGTLVCTNNEKSYINKSCISIQL